MAKLMIDLTPEQVAQLLRDLPPEHLRLVLERLADRLEPEDGKLTPAKPDEKE